MKIEQALQQVLSSRDQMYKPDQDDPFFSSDLEAIADIKIKIDDLWESHRHGYSDVKTKRALAKRSLLPRFNL